MNNYDLEKRIEDLEKEVKLLRRIKELQDEIERLKSPYPWYPYYPTIIYKYKWVEPYPTTVDPYLWETGTYIYPGTITTLNPNSSGTTTYINKDQFTYT